MQVEERSASVMTQRRLPATSWNSGLGSPRARKFVLAGVLGRDVAPVAVLVAGKVDGGAEAPVSGFILEDPDRTRRRHAGADGNEGRPSSEGLPVADQRLDLDASPAQAGQEREVRAAVEGQRPRPPRLPHRAKSPLPGAAPVIGGGELADGAIDHRLKLDR